MLGQFNIAAFAFDGELIGMGEQRIDELSEKWITFCDSLLAANGAAFDAGFGGPLDHIAVRYTAARGSALVTMSVHEIVASSWVLLGGLNPEADAEARDMFIASLRDVDLVRTASATTHPFEKLFQIEERPLAALVVWGASNTSDEDDDLVRELSQHFAAAHFLRARSFGSGSA